MGQRGKQWRDIGTMMGMTNHPKKNVKEKLALQMPPGQIDIIEIFFAMVDISQDDTVSYETLNQGRGSETPVIENFHQGVYPLIKASTDDLKKKLARRLLEKYLLTDSLVPEEPVEEKKFVNVSRAVGGYHNFFSPPSLAANFSPTGVVFTPTKVYPPPSPTKNMNDTKLKGYLQVFKEKHCHQPTLIFHFFEHFNLYHKTTFDSR